MGHFVGHPERQQLGSQPQAVGFGVDSAGEVLHADEGDPSAVHHQLARVRGAHPHHEHAVGGAVDLQHLLGPMQRLLDHLRDVHLGEASPGGRCGRRATAFAITRVGVRAVEVEDVVAPVGGEQRAMGVEETVIGRFWIRLGENVKKIGEEIDEHETR